MFVLHAVDTYQQPSFLTFHWHRGLCSLRWLCWGRGAWTPSVCLSHRCHMPTQPPPPSTHNTSYSMVVCVAGRSSSIRLY